MCGRKLVMLTTNCLSSPTMTTTTIALHIIIQTWCSKLLFPYVCMFECLYIFKWALNSYGQPATSIVSTSSTSRRVRTIIWDFPNVRIVNARWNETPSAEQNWASVWTQVNTSVWLDRKVMFAMKLHIPPLCPAQCVYLPFNKAWLMFQLFTGNTKYGKYSNKDYANISLVFNLGKYRNYAHAVTKEGWRV